MKTKNTNITFKAVDIPENVKKYVDEEYLKKCIEENFEKFKLSNDAEIEKYILSVMDYQLQDFGGELCAVIYEIDEISSHINSYKDYFIELGNKTSVIYNELSTQISILNADNNEFTYDIKVIDKNLSTVNTYISALSGNIQSCIHTITKLKDDTTFSDQIILVNNKISSLTSIYNEMLNSSEWIMSTGISTEFESLSNLIFSQGQKILTAAVLKDDIKYDKTNKELQISDVKIPLDDVTVNVEGSVEEIEEAKNTAKEAKDEIEALKAEVSQFSTDTQTNVNKLASNQVFFDSNDANSWFSVTPRNNIVAANNIQTFGSWYNPATWFTDDSGFDIKIKQEVIDSLNCTELSTKLVTEYQKIITEKINDIDVDDFIDDNKLVDKYYSTAQLTIIGKTLKLIDTLSTMSLLNLFDCFKTTDAYKEINDISTQINFYVDSADKIDSTKKEPLKTAINEVLIGHYRSEQLYLYRQIINKLNTKHVSICNELTELYKDTLNEIQNYDIEDTYKLSVVTEYHNNQLTCDMHTNLSTVHWCITDMLSTHGDKLYYDILYAYASSKNISVEFYDNIKDIINENNTIVDTSKNEINRFIDLMIRSASYNAYYKYKTVQKFQDDAFLDVEKKEIELCEDIFESVEKKYEEFITTNFYNPIYTQCGLNSSNNNIRFNSQQIALNIKQLFANNSSSYKFIMNGSEIDNTQFESEEYKRELKKVLVSELTNRYAQLSASLQKIFDDGKTAKQTENSKIVLCDSVYKRNILDKHVVLSAFLANSLNKVYDGVVNGKTYEYDYSKSSFEDILNTLYDSFVVDAGTFVNELYANGIDIVSENYDKITEEIENRLNTYRDNISGLIESGSSVYASIKKYAEDTGSNLKNKVNQFIQDCVVATYSLAKSNNTLLSSDTVYTAGKDFGQQSIDIISCDDGKYVQLHEFNMSNNNIDIELFPTNSTETSEYQFLIRETNTNNGIIGNTLKYANVIDLLSSYNKNNTDSEISATYIKLYDKNGNQINNKEFEIKNNIIFKNSNTITFDISENSNGDIIISAEAHYDTSY